MWMRKPVMYFTFIVMLAIGYEAAFGSDPSDLYRDAGPAKLPPPQGNLRPQCGAEKKSCIEIINGRFVSYWWDGEKMAGSMHACKNPDGRGNGRAYPCTWDRKRDGETNPKFRFRVFSFSVEDTNRVESE